MMLNERYLALRNNFQTDEGVLPTSDEYTLLTGCCLIAQAIDGLTAAVKALREPEVVTFGDSPVRTSAPEPRP